MTNNEQDELIIESIVKIGNSPNIIKNCEPNIAFPMQLKPWMIKRTLVSLQLFRKELDNYANEIKKT